MIIRRSFLWQSTKLLVVAGFLGVTVLLILISSVAYKFEGDAVFPADCALVFGAAVHRGGEPGPGIERRVQTAVRLYHEEKIQLLYLSGGKGSGQEASEAEVMRGVALREGVDPDDVHTEEAATSTIENLTFAQPMMDHCTSVVGISDRYHLARIAFIADRLDWENFSTYPADWNASRHFEAQSILRESLGMLYTLVTFFPEQERFQM